MGNFLFRRIFAIFVKNTCSQDCDAYPFGYLPCHFVRFYVLAVEIQFLDPKLFEGDLLLTPEQREAIKHATTSDTNQFAAIRTNQWPTTSIAWSASKEICEKFFYHF